MNKRITSHYAVNRSRQKWLKRLITLVELAILMVDLNPVISEPLRYGVLFGAQALGGNVAISAIAFGSVTCLLDILGTLAIADLLTSHLAVKTFTKIRSLIRSMKLGKMLTFQTTFMTDAGVTLLVGAPVALFIKQQQDPDRRRKDNIRLGLLLAGINAAAAILQGGALVAGLWHPSLLTICLAALALASIAGTQQWLKRISNKPKAAR